MKKILVPVDFSQTSTDALLFATKIFKEDPIEITVLNVFGTQSTALMMRSIDSILVKDAEENFNKLFKKITEKAPHVQLKKKIVKNYAESAIISMGDSGVFDFLVMGTKGASGLKEVFVGSVAGSVISKTKAPVIVVPPNYSSTSIDQIVLAVGNTPLSKPEVINPLKEIINKNKADIEVLHISDKESADLEETIKLLEEFSPSVTYSFGSGDTHDDLNDYLESNKADLLCMIRTKKGFFERLLDGSVTLKQTFDATIPLLILQN